VQNPVHVHTFLTIGVGANVRAAVAGDEPVVPFAAGGGCGWSLSRTPPKRSRGIPVRPDHRQSIILLIKKHQHEQNNVDTALIH